MTHYPASKIESDIKRPMKDLRPNPGKAATPSSPGDGERRTFADGIDTAAIQTGRMQGAT